MILYVVVCDDDVMVRNTEKEARASMLIVAGEQDAYDVDLYRAQLEPTRANMVALANGAYRPQAGLTERITTDGKHWYKCKCCDSLTLPDGTMGGTVCDECIEKRTP
jgi:hypothetical protein